MSAAETIRASVQALPAELRQPWAASGHGADEVWAVLGDEGSWVCSTDAVVGLDAHIARLASPDVAAKLADLLDAIDALEQTGDHIPLGAAVPLGRVLRTRDALEAVIDRSGT